MNKITQDMRYKQAVIEYSMKHGVTKAACVRSTGSLFAMSFFLFLLCNLSLTNLHCGGCAFRAANAAANLQAVSANIIVANFMGL